MQTLLDIWISPEESLSKEASITEYDYARLRFRRCTQFSRTISIDGFVDGEMTLDMQNKSATFSGNSR
jgi:hypothetical protein